VLFIKGDGVFLFIVGNSVIKNDIKATKCVIIFKLLYGIGDIQ